MIVFEYYLTLEKGYRPVQKVHTINDVTFQILAPNRATADRMVKAFLNDNVSYYDCVAIADIDESEA